MANPVHKLEAVLLIQGISFEYTTGKYNTFESVENKLKSLNSLLNNKFTEFSINKVSDIIHKQYFATVIYYLNADEDAPLQFPVLLLSRPSDPIHVVSTVTGFTLTFTRLKTVVNPSSIFNASHVSIQPVNILQ
jgi:hypothetical protein